MTRRAGICIPLFSLRTDDASDWGVGEIPQLVPLARWARRAGLGVVQLLPVCEAALGQASPYFARTAFALDPAYLALDEVEDFAAAGGVAALPGELQERLAWLRGARRVHWGPVREVKQAALELAFRWFAGREQGERGRELERYVEEHADWLDDYALFAALQEAHRSEWTRWPEALRHREPAALDEARQTHAARIAFHRYVQWQLDRQWRATRRAVNAEGVRLMGDLPFMVAGDSADVWQRAGEFRLDATIGVPPDAFSSEGQDWGLPMFDWATMRADDYEWMRERAERAAELFGLYRIDHVVGLYRTWYIPLDKARDKGFDPADEPAQLRQGERLIEILQRGEATAESPVIAEDLGTVPDFVRESLTRLGVPGYRVQRWEKDGARFRDPRSWPALSVATTGTHDTESLADWYDALSDDERRELLSLPDLAALAAAAPARFDDRVRDTLLALVYRAGSDLVLTPFQDLFGHRERINLPGTLNSENWSYRLPWSLAELGARDEDTRRLHGLAALR